MSIDTTKKRLLVFPGGGSPENSVYHGVYALIEKGAKVYGYNEVVLCYWPGQKAGDGAVLEFDAAVEVASAAVVNMESQDVPYDILGRSYGSIVAAKIANASPLKSLQRIIMWGPPPYSVLWDVFKRDFEAARKKAESKGTVLSDKFFDSITPIETLLPSIKYNCVVATGTDDPYVPPEYLVYLQQLVSGKDNFIFREAEKCPHEVTQEMPDEVKSEYLSKIFN